MLFSIAKISRPKIQIIVFVCAVLMSVFLVSTKSAYAAYEPGRLIDDSSFLDTQSMGKDEIQNFLVARNSGLKDMSFNLNCNGPNSKERQLYTAAGAQCDTPIPASHIIYYASQIYGLSPKVILATMQKEQSLVTAANPTIWQLTQAMGYGCPTSGSCDTSSSFPYQIDNGAWALRFHYERASGNNSWWSNLGWACNGSNQTYYKPSLYPGQNVQFFDGNNVNYTTIFIQNAATSAMYCYTPHAYNNPDGLYGRAPYGTTGQYYSGSYNFVYFYELWFPNWDYSFVNSSVAYVDFEPGYKRIGHWIRIKNTGNHTWYADGSVPAGERPVRLAMTGYQPNPFADTSDPNWLGTNNQIKMTPSVVAPGETATFAFNIVGPQYQIPNYTSYEFTPVIDGVQFMKNINMRHYYRNIPGSSSLVESTMPDVIYPNESKNVYLKFRNNGLKNWYADGSVPAGERPVRLAMTGYQPNPFADTSDPNWLGTNNQIKMTPSVVAPGETATFAFNIVGPYGVKSNIGYYFSSLPTLDGFGVLSQPTGLKNVTTPSSVTDYEFVSAINPPTVMSPGQTANVQLVLKNKGSVVWSNENSKGTRLRLATISPAYRNSPFYNSSDNKWITSSQVIYTGRQIGLNDTVVFDFTYKAPTTTGRYIEKFAPVLDGYEFLPDKGMQFNVEVK